MKDFTHALCFCSFLIFRRILAAEPWNLKKFENFESLCKASQLFLFHVKAIICYNRMFSNDFFKTVIDWTT